MKKKVEDVWNEFNRQLLNYIKAKVNSESDAEDILQDVFVKIFNNIDNVNEGVDLKSWIYKVTKNRIIDYYRKRKDLNVDIEYLKGIEQDEDNEINMNEEVIGCLEALIFELPEKYSKPLYLHDIKQKRYKDISYELGMSLSCAKMRVSRARDLLKNTMLKCCNFELDIFGNIIDYEVKNKYCDKFTNECR